MYKQGDLKKENKGTDYIKSEEKKKLKNNILLKSTENS